jgi:hypothetical protein
MPIRFISVFTCRRPIWHPSAASRPRNMREPAKGDCRCSLSRRRITSRSLADTTATANIQSRRLLGDGQIVLTVDHRFALSNPALVSAPSKKSVSSVSSPILACRDFARLRRCGAVQAKNIRSPVLKLRLPCCDLIGMNVELLSQLSECSIVFNRRQLMVSPDSIGTACPPSGRTNFRDQLSRRWQRAATGSPIPFRGLAGSLRWIEARKAHQSRG